MQFRLRYGGPLPSNGTPADKHTIRRQIHSQLKDLWDQAPLDGMRHFLWQEPHPDRVASLLRVVDDRKFVPLISSMHGWNNVAELSILLLRPCEPGALINHGGDLDNRLKTLFDALTLPSSQQLPLNWKAHHPENELFFVLLEDDILVTRLAIKTDRLLGQSVGSTSYVELVIHVTIRVTRTSLENVGIAG